MRSATVQLTQQAHHAIEYARRKAVDSGSQLLEPEHLLWGILHDERITLPDILMATGHTAEALCQSLETFLSSNPRLQDHEPTESRLEAVQASDATKHVLKQAATVCIHQQQSHIGPQHLLLAMLESPSARLTTFWKSQEIVAVVAAQQQQGTQASAVSYKDGYEGDCPPPPFVESEGEPSRTTEKMNAVIYCAGREAYQAGHMTISAFYLLAGLLRNEKTVAEEVMRLCGAERIGLCEGLVDLLNPGSDTWDGSANMDYDATFLRVYSIAIAERAWLGDKHLGTEHFLLGLLADKHTTGKFLRSNGLTRKNVLRQIRNVRRGGGMIPRRNMPGVPGYAWSILVLAVVGFIVFLLLAAP